MLPQAHALKNRLKAAWTAFRNQEPPAAPLLPVALNYYVRSAPCPQNALDIFQGEWSSALPGEYASLRAGESRLFEDDRITWAAEALGGFEGRTVLELGPLEGGHTYMIEKLGAASVVAVEANVRAYLKCLITKELLGLRRCRFLCGDLMEYLRTDPTRFDICIASGVLYHMRRPVDLLALLAARTDRLFLWTHYYDPAAIARNGPVAERFTGSAPADHAGFRHTLHRYEYRQALEWNGFCGGSESYSHWMEREAILACLRWLGFDELRIGFEDPDFPHGPCFGVAALRRQSSAPSVR